MFMICSVATSDSPSTRYWTNYFEVKEGGHFMSAWKNLEGTFGASPASGDDVASQWEEFVKTQGLDRGSCAIAGTLKTIMTQKDRSRAAQPSVLQDDKRFESWRPGKNAAGKTFLVATYDRIGQKVE